MGEGLNKWTSRILGTIIGVGWTMQTFRWYILEDKNLTSFIAFILTLGIGLFFCKVAYDAWFKM